MDRYGEIYTTYDKILTGIRMHPDALVIANGDAPIFNSKELKNKVVYYGFADKEEEDQKLPQIPMVCFVRAATIFCILNTEPTATLANISVPNAVLNDLN